MELGIGLISLAILLALYLIPSLVARGRGHHNQLAVFILNVLFGWTVLGWGAALVWACTTTGQPATAGQKLR